jgi:hypothetical protein
MSVSCECCVLSLRRAGPSSRGVLPSVVCLMCVIMKPRRNEEAQAHIGLSSHRKEKKRGKELQIYLNYVCGRGREAGGVAVGRCLCD